MGRVRRFFDAHQPTVRLLTRGDAVVLVGLAGLLSAGIHLGRHAPILLEGPDVSLAPGALPWYAAFSLLRMLAAYALSLLFALTYGWLAARRRRAERFLLPLLDVLQSVPILSFLPIVLLSLAVLLPRAVAAELASVVLIVTSQAWNLAFVWYQSLTTIPKELTEASRMFRFNGWLRFRILELPFGAIGLIWNSMMSWAGGWFFLMAAETFTVGQRDFRLPGLGTYLQAAASRGDARAIAWGLTALLLLIVALDQAVWRPLLARADRFKLEMVEGDLPTRSWMYEALRSSRLVAWLAGRARVAVLDRLDAFTLRRCPARSEAEPVGRARAWGVWAGWAAAGSLLLYGAARAGGLLFALPPLAWAEIGVALLATGARVALALAIALLWMIPLGVVIGADPRLAARLQPLVQILAAVPATAVFPVLVLLLAGAPGGLNLAAVLLMLLGTQWYLLFNVIAGVTAIPQDLRHTAALLGLRRRERWRVLVLPALFPFIVTGAITASGGAWNASIVAEYTEFGGRTFAVRGIGGMIAQATGAGDYPLLLAATLSMILAVVAINRAVWRPLYRLARDRYRLE
jgi:NitT/TauT family transport system permease protein